MLFRSEIVLDENEITDKNEKIICVRRSFGLRTLLMIKKAHIKLRL